MAILKRGSSGPDVQALQQRLSDLGFDPNGLDGNFGPGTEAAVRAFQAVNGLGVDGKVGPDTLAALQASVSNAGGGGLSDATGGMDATGDGNGDDAGPPPPPPPPGGSKLLNDD